MRAHTRVVYGLHGGARRECSHAVWRALSAQQLSQIVPAQLQQLQQVLQIATHQSPYLQQPFQQYGQSFQNPFGFGVATPAFGGQTAAHVM